MTTEQLMKRACHLERWRGWICSQNFRVSCGILRRQGNLFPDICAERSRRSMTSWWNVSLTICRFDLAFSDYAEV